MPIENDMQSKKLAGSKAGPSTKKFLDFNEVKEDTVVMKDGTLRAVLMVSSINFALKSEDEQNAIIQAACYGVALHGATLYCTDSPCLLCATMIVTAGIKEVVFESPYWFSAQAARLLKTAGIRCRRFKRKARQIS